MTAQAQQLVEEPPQFSAETLAKVEEIRRRYHVGEEPSISGEEFKAHLKQLREKFRAQDQGAQIV